MICPHVKRKLVAEKKRKIKKEKKRKEKKKKNTCTTIEDGLGSAFDPK